MGLSHMSIPINGLYRPPLSCCRLGDPTGLGKSKCYTDKYAHRGLWKGKGHRSPHINIQRTKAKGGIEITIQIIWFKINLFRIFPFSVCMFMCLCITSIYLVQKKVYTLTADTIIMSVSGSMNSWYFWFHPNDGFYVHMSNGTDHLTKWLVIFLFTL